GGGRGSGAWGGGGGEQGVGGGRLRGGRRRRGGDVIQRQAVRVAGTRRRHSRHDWRNGYRGRSVASMGTVMARVYHGRAGQWRKPRGGATGLPVPASASRRSERAAAGPRWSPTAPAGPSRRRRRRRTLAVLACPYRPVARSRP